MISDRRSNANRKILVQGVGEKPAANAPSVETLPALRYRLQTPNGHIDLFCHLIPGQAFLTQLQDRCVEADERKDRYDGLEASAPRI